MPPAGRPARIGFLLSQLGAHATDVFAAQVRTLGVTPSEAGVIRIIARDPELMQRELAARLDTVPSRVVALVDGLERKGLARRTRGEPDRRAQYVGLTDAGRALLVELRKAAETQEATLTESLSAQQRTDLYALLSTLSGRLGLDADVHPGYRDAPGGASVSEVSARLVDEGIRVVGPDTDPVDGVRSPVRRQAGQRDRHRA